MPPASLWRVSVTTSVEAEEVVMALLGSHFASAPAAYHEAGTPRTTASVFLSSPPASEALDALSDALRALWRSDLQARPGSVQVRRIPGEDWAESWKRHFKPLAVGRHLLLKPGWSRRRALPGQRVVVLDPGLSFGTGHHPTTWFCLRCLVLDRPAREAKSFLDLGTGSGILAIAAAKLGYHPILAIDHDPDAVRIAQQNARRNRVSDRIRFRELDVKNLSVRHPTTCDLVGANLTSDLLVGHRRRIAACVKPGGILVLAGILRREFRSVAAAYGRLGFQLQARSGRADWTSACFLRSKERLPCADDLHRIRRAGRKAV